MSFMFRQLFNRLLIMSPAFIRVIIFVWRFHKRCLNNSDTTTNILRADDILKTDFAKVGVLRRFQEGLFQRYRCQRV